MGLENVQFIDDLDPSNPLPTDKRREGDDHIRNIKLAIKNTFPGINIPLTATAAELNAMDGWNLPETVIEVMGTKLEADDLPDLSGLAALDAENTWTKVQSQGVVDLGNLSGNLVIDGDAGTCFRGVLIGDITTLSVQNLQEGQEVTLRLQQGGAGSHVIEAYSSQFHFPEGIEPNLSTTAGAYDVIAGKVIANIVVCGFLRNLGSV